MLRELVYLSDRKLEQFLPALRSMWPRPKVTIKMPVVEIGVEPTPEAERSKLKQLARVIAHIERTARWYTDPGAAAGQWVHFEAPLNYLVLDGGPVPGMVLFVDRATRSADYPEAGATRLILHCSSSHLRVEGRPQKVIPPTGQEMDPAAYLGSGAAAFTPNNVDLLIGLLRAQPPASDGRSVVPDHNTCRAPPSTCCGRSTAGHTRRRRRGWRGTHASPPASWAGPALPAT